MARWFDQTWHLFLPSLALVAGMVGSDLARAQQSEPNVTEDTWATIRDDIFRKQKLEDGTGLVALETPARAEDAALVPVSVRVTLPAGDSRKVKTITLVIDENPAPVAGIFEIGTESGLTMISTRVRVNSYSYVHAAAELSDGKLYVVKSYVKASGGCSAPALKDADSAKKSVGALKLRQFAQSTEGPAIGTREAQIMIRHPNFSGLQMDQITRLYIPADFVQDMRIWQGDTLIFALDGGISVSEDPNIRFNYRANGASFIRAEVRDSQGRMFQASWPVDASGM
jgi:sulfur-oxidizing protein SoxY